MFGELGNNDVALCGLGANPRGFAAALPIHSSKLVIVLSNCLYILISALDASFQGRFL